ncbi:MAG: hypothetical protein ACOCNC_13080 [Acetivibrio ethanolgignens]
MKKKRRLLTGIWLLAFAAALILGGCGKTTTISEEIDQTAEPEATPAVFQGGSLTLSIDYGYDKYVKNGRYMRVLADITNEGADFSGTLQVIIPSHSQEKFMYQKEVSLAAGETKRLEMAVPVDSSANRYNFLLADKEENVVAKKTVKAYVYRESTFFTGILTDDIQGLSYLSDNQMKTFYLETDTFPEDVMGLDSLDILIINDFNTDQLNEKQYEAVKNFVMQGGTLVLGSGSTGVKTLAVFDDSFLTGTMGEVFSKDTTFGLNEERLQEIKTQFLEETLEQQTSAPEENSINQLTVNAIKKDILDIHLEGATTLVKEDDVVLLEGLYKGKGRVLLSTMDLGLDTGLWNTIGREIAEKIADNVSISRRVRINEETQGNDYSYLKHSVVDMVDEDKIPKVGKYIVVLLVYVLLIGPPLYIVLKKLDKRNLIWVIIPAFSVLFGSFIYGIGGQTRQDDPYIGFLTINTQNNGILNQETIFGVTAPYNDDYDLNFSSDKNIVPEVEINNYYHSSTTVPEDSSYNIAVKYGGSTTQIRVRDYPAFETVYFNMTSSEPAAGEVASSLSFDEWKITGGVTNRLGYDLKQAVLYAYGVIYPLGDLEQGQSVTLDEKESILTINPGGIYNNDLLTKISGGSPYGHPKGQRTENVRWYYAYEYMLSKMVSRADQGCYLIGFSENAESEFLEETGLDTNGASMTVAEVPVDLTGELGTLIPRVDVYMQNVDGAYNMGGRYIYEDSLSMDLQFGSDERITRLVYSEELNYEFKQISYPNTFAGEILGYNYTTGEYDILFESEQAGSVDIRPYLSEDNRVRLSIRPDAAVIQNYGQVVMPVLSAVKEER